MGAPFSLFSVFPLSWILWLTIPPCLVAGLALAIVGWRARARWSQPTCARCGYDLRGRTPESSPNCPECGAALADKPEAVRFGLGSRHRAILALALVVLLLPFLELGGIEAYRYVQARRNPPPVTPATMSQQPTPVVLQTLATNANTPWPWNELEARLKGGRLTPADVGAAVEQLIVYLNSRPLGYGRDITWQRKFVDQAWQSRMVADEQMLRLAEAIYGPTPRIEPLRLRVSSKTASITACAASAHGDPLPVQLFNELREVRFDGQPVRLGEAVRTGAFLSGKLEGPFMAGTHTIEVETESALIDKNDAGGLSPHAPAEEWPRALRRWRRTGSITVTAHPDDAQLVELATDPTLDPMRDGLVSVVSIDVRPIRGGARLFVHLNVSPDAVPLSVDVQLRVGSSVVNAGSYYHFRGGFSALELSVAVDSIPREIEDADVTLKPNPRYVDEFPEVTRIWGKEIVMEKVPLRRYDTATEPANDK